MNQIEPLEALTTIIGGAAIFSLVFVAIVALAAIFASMRKTTKVCSSCHHELPLNFFDDHHQCYYCDNRPERPDY